MAFAPPVWLAVQHELLGPDAATEHSSCFDHFDDDSLMQMFHLTRPCISFIADTVRTRMKTVALKKPEVSVDSMVMVTLNYYAHGVSSTSILQRLGATQADCLGIICTVSGVIAGMSDQFISFPKTDASRADVASKIERVCGIPAVLGVLSPAHFKIRASSCEKDRTFVNNMGYTSVVSQMIVDSHCNILSVEKCCVGSTSEQELWDTSFKGKEVEDERHGAYWVVGGRGYVLSKHVLTPVAEPAGEEEERFNEAHAKIHDIVQKTLSSMKRRFGCLTQLGFAQEGSLDKKSNIIKACSVLHNIAKKFSVPPPPVESKLEDVFPAKLRAQTPEISPEALRARQELISRVFCHASAAWRTRGGRDFSA